MGVFIITGVVLIFLISFMFFKNFLSLKSISIISVLFLTIIIVLYVLFFVNFHSVSLKDESLGGFKIGQEIDNHMLKKSDQFSSDNEVVYSKKGDGDFLVTSNKDDQIISITNQSQDQKIKTSKGIKIFDTFQDVIKTYGEEYKNLWFVEGYETGIQYQDKDEQLLLEFFFNEDKLYRIELIKK
ncbi:MULTISPECIES: hypothetical protein [Bacillus]|uniref:hypothetical protein n=1 Tax=Bacillus TaxID=1386 RepID=UPI0009ADC07F|nr:hypothetical protein [Bacillus altitudinis]OPW98416.1 hypothetical protein BG911_10805 [Bacillus altitudinis]PGD45888.1 hypothetical protein COM17_04175 [Bacillus altitudinis]